MAKPSVLVVPDRVATGDKRCGCCGETKPRSEFYREPYIAPSGKETSRCTGTCNVCILTADDLARRNDVERLCTLCQKIKPVSQFAVSRKLTKIAGIATLRFRGECKDCQRLRNQAWRLANVEAYRARYREARRKRTPEQKLKWLLKQEYGLTLEDYQRMMAAQDGRCAICRETPAPQKYKTGFHVDHCHTTGRIRGLLCHNCNVSIGHLKEDLVRIRALLAYLERHSG